MAVAAACALPLLKAVAIADANAVDPPGVGVGVGVETDSAVAEAAALLCAKAPWDNSSRQRSKAAILHTDMPECCSRAIDVGFGGARSLLAMLEMRVAEPKLRYFYVSARSIRFRPSVIIRQTWQERIWSVQGCSTSAEAWAGHDDMSTITVWQAAPHAIKPLHVDSMCGSSWPNAAINVYPNTPG